MSRESVVRGLLMAVAALGLAGCADPNWLAAPSGHLTLSNFRFEHVRVQTAVTASPDCNAGGAAVADFDLPFMGTRVIKAAPDGDICWRRQIGAGNWTDWNRAYTANGRSVDSQL